MQTKTSVNFFSALGQSSSSFAGAFAPFFGIFYLNYKVLTNIQNQKSNFFHEIGVLGFWGFGVLGGKYRV
jgi:hypothetical protein